MGHPAQTILLLDDDQTVSRLLCFALRHAGYRVLTASSRAEAIGAGQLHNGAIDLILCDVMLGHETATAVVAGLRELRPGIPVLFISGSSLGDLLHDALLEPSMLADGSTFFLQKPFLPEMLVSTVRSVLAGQVVPNGARWRSEELNTHA